MFKRSNNAKATKEENNKNRSELKAEKMIGSIGKGGKASAISLQSPNDEETVIGEGVIIEGKISGSGNLIIEGLMKGDVDLKESSFTVGPKGRVEGEIFVKDAVTESVKVGSV